MFKASSYIALVVGFIFISFYPSPICIAATIDERKTSTLALEPGWLALGHYRSSRLYKQPVSEADNATFFLTPNGRSNPTEELLYWKNLLLSHNKLVPIAVCRFPARYLWAADAFGVNPPWSLEECEELKIWRSKLSGDIVSIVFASAYIESPSSMFGHSFLRFQQPNEATILGTNTVNYAADASDRSGIVDFAYRGLFGGFPGVSDQLPLYRRMRDYADNEGRDLIEYFLDLNPKEVDLLKLHLFEIRGRDFDYFFLDENCSYRLLASINTVRPDLELLDGFERWAIPIDTIKQLERKNLVTHVVDWPSATRRLYFHNDQLNKAASDLAVAIAKGEVAPSNTSGISSDEYAKILYVAGEYNALLISQDKIDRKKSKTISHAIMRARLDLNTVTDWPEMPKLKHTGDGHASGRYSVALGDMADLPYVDINYRSAYHTFEDPLFGFNPGAEVVILNYGARLLEDRLVLQKLELIRVKSRTPANKFFSPPSWDFGAVYKEKYFSDERHHVFSIEYLKGKSFLIEGHIFSGLLGGNLDFSNEFINNNGLELLGRASIIKQNETYSYNLAYQQGCYVSGIYSPTKSLSMVFGLPMKKDLLTLALERKFGGTNYQTEIQLGFNRYF